MDIYRKRFSQLNPILQQQQRRRTAITLIQPVQQPFVRPRILPSAPRPQPRQQTRSKQYQDTQRANTAYNKHEQISSTESNPPYITLANLTKILDVLQTNVKISDSEASIETNTSTTTSSRQRVQQHLQETATRWWKPIRSFDCQSAVHVPTSTVHHQQDSCNPSSSTVIVNSDIPSDIVNRNLDESESSTEIQSITQPTSISNTKCTRLEPLIMPSRTMRLYTTNYQRYFKNPIHLNFLQHHRLIRQT